MTDLIPNFPGDRAVQPFRGRDERHGSQAQVFHRLRGHPRRHARQVARYPEKTGQQKVAHLYNLVCQSYFRKIIFQMLSNLLSFRFHKDLRNE